MVTDLLNFFPKIPNKGSFKKYFRWGQGGGGHWKANKNEQGEGEDPSICVRSL